MLDSELKAETARCLGCKIKPCQKACPLGVSPTDFIQATKEGDFAQAARIIVEKNPLAQTCGLVCPDRFCQKACIRGRIDKAIEIPCLQAEIIKRGGYPALVLPERIGKKAAIVGGGPAGVGACYEFLLSGWDVDIYEAQNILGGAARLIPEYRLKHQVLDAEIKRIVDNPRVQVFLGTKITDFQTLKEGYDSIVSALGEIKPRTQGIIGESYCVPYGTYLLNPEKFKGVKICVAGGGEVALDCALTAKKNGAETVEMFVRRRRDDMRIMQRDQNELDACGVVVRELSSITKIQRATKGFELEITGNYIDAAGFACPLDGTSQRLFGYDVLIEALGAYYPKDEIPQNCVIAGDMTGLCGTVVQALASGRAAAKREIEEKA